MQIQEISNRLFEIDIDLLSKSINNNFEEENQNDDSSNSEVENQSSTNEDEDEKELIQLDVKDLLESLKDILTKTETWTDQNIQILNGLNVKLNDFNCVFDNMIKSIKDSISNILSQNLQETSMSISESESIYQQPVELEVRQRSDEDIIPLNKVKVNSKMEQLFSDIMNKNANTSLSLDVIFNPELYSIVNKSIRDKQNTYTLDPYGLVIRRKSYNKKSDPYAWKYNKNNQPIHYLVDENTKSFQENIDIVLNAQYISKPQHFVSGIIEKLYIDRYPERLFKFVSKEEIKTKRISIKTKSK